MLLRTAEDTGFNQGGRLANDDEEAVKVLVTGFGVSKSQLSSCSTYVDLVAL